MLIAQRPADKELAGRWEFPGGKLKAGEEPRAGLVRELREELGVEAGSAERVLRYSHQYPDKLVWLELWIVTAWSGEPRGLDGQQVRWVAVEALANQDILEADQPMIQALLTRCR